MNFTANVQQALDIFASINIKSSCLYANKHKQVQLQNLHIFSTDWKTMAQQYNGVHYWKNSLGTYVQQLSIYLYKTVHKNILTQPVWNPNHSAVSS